MATQEFKTFWDIEKEKTWRIYILFGFLMLLYFIPIFIIWVLIKFFIYLRQSLAGTAAFTVLGADTWFVLIAAAVISAIHWYYSNKTVVSKILNLFGARYPDKNDRYHYIFQHVVDEIEAAAGGLRVERYIVSTGAMNAFALADLNGRQVVGVTEGLLSRLSRDELQAVVAHEMAHIVSNDCLETTITCSLFGVYSEMLERYNRALSRAKPYPASSFRWGVREYAPHGDAIAFSFLSFPVLLLLFVADTLSQLLKMFISREREYRADASAVKLTRNPLSLAGALYKISTHWRGAGYAGEHLSPIFIIGPKLNPLGMKENTYAKLFSTHPPLARRLQVILNLAHADLSQISQHLSRDRILRTEPEATKSVIKFFAEYKDKWQGPFTILQLQSKDWLKPETRLHAEGSNEIISAIEIPALSYFFQKRDEPIWKMRRLCPGCREWLIVQEYEGLYLWRCAFCDGILVEIDKLPRIFVRKERGFSEQVLRLAQLLQKDAEKKHPHFKILLDMVNPRRCPKCGKNMLHKFYSYAYHIEVDECPVCKLTWFDADELEILQCLIEMEEAKT